MSDDIELQAYLEEGCLNGVDKRYKCSTRDPWYSVPQMSPPDMFLTYMCGKQARLMLNGAGINSTNTVHNVFLRDRTENAAPCVAAFYNSLTALSIELVGRTYGGGMLKIEPSDCRDILLPSVRNLQSLDPDAVASILNNVSEAQ